MTHVRICVPRGVILYWIDEEVFCPKIENHAEQYQGRTQHPTVPERQANAQPLEEGRSPLTGVWGCPPNFLSLCSPPKAASQEWMSNYPKRMKEACTGFL